MVAGGRDKIARLSQLTAALAVGVIRAASGHAGRRHSAAQLFAAGVVGGILGQRLSGHGGQGVALLVLEYLVADAASVVLVVALCCAGSRLRGRLGHLVTQSGQRFSNHGGLGGLVSLEYLIADAASPIFVVAGLGAGGSLGRGLGQLVTQSLDHPAVLGDLGLAVLVGEELSTGATGVILAVANLSAGSSLGFHLGQRMTQRGDGVFLGLGGEQLAAEGRRVDGLAIHCAGGGGSAYTDKSDIRLHRFAIGALDSGCAALVVVTPLILSRAPGMDTGSLHIAANGALVFLIAGLAVECVLDHRVSRVAAGALVVVTGSVRIDPRAREVVIQSLDHPTILDDLGLAVRVGEELAAVTAGVVLAVAGLGAGGSLGVGLGQLVTQSRQRLVGHGCLGGLISLEHLFADAASVILVIAAFGAGSGNRLNLGQAMPRCLDRLGLCLTAHLAGVGLHAIRGAGGGRSHFTVVPAVLPGGLHIAALGFGAGGSVFALVGGIGVLGLVDDVMAHGAFLPVVGFVMLPLVLMGDHGDRLGLLIATLGAGKGLHASFGAGGGRSLNAGIPRMCSLVHNGAAAVHVPVVVLVRLPLVALIAGAVSMRLVLFLAADAAPDGMIRCAFLIAANNQYPLMPGGRDCYFFDRRLFTNSTIVVEIIIIATGTKPVSNTTVAVAGRLLGGIEHQISMPGLIDHLFSRGGNLRVRVLVQLTASAPIILIIAILSAGMRLGGNLSQCVGTTGVLRRCHAAGDGESTGSRRKCNIFLIIVTNIILVSGVLKSHNRITICNPCIHRKRKLQECTYTAVVLTMIPKQLSALCCQRSGHSLALRNFSERQFRLIISDR